MAENTVNTLNGLLRIVYPEGIDEDLIYEENKICDLVKFNSAMQLGQKVRIPVPTGLEQGVIAAAAGSGAFAFPQATPGSVTYAEVDGWNLAGMAELDYETATKAMQSNSKQAAKSALDHVIQSLRKSLQKRLEINFLYGQTEIGVVDTYSSGTTLGITSASWAAYMWSGMKKANIDVYSSSGTYKFTAQITAVNVDGKTITVDHVTSAATGDLIYYATFKAAEGPGMYKILTNTGSLFGIDASVDDVWKGNSVNVSGNLTRAQLGRGMAKAMDHGMSGQFLGYVNPRIFADLVEEENTLFRYNDSNANAKIGAKSLQISVGESSCVIEPHPAVKLSHCFLLNTKSWTRVGSADLKLGDPMDKDNIVVPLPNNAGYGVRGWGFQQIFCKAPATNVVLTGITAAS